MRVLLLLVILWSSALAMGQPIGPNRYSELGASVGLPNDAINALTQDSQGFLWVATWKGLFRFDGHRAVNFSQLNYRFKGVKITSLRYSPAQHTLWLGTFVDGAFAIDTRDYSFRQYLPEGSLGRRIADANIIAVEVLPTGEVLLGGENNGLSILHGDSLHVLTTQNSALPSNQISAFLVSPKTGVWIGTGVGVCRTASMTQPLQRVEADAIDRFVYDLQEATDGTIWVGHKIGCHRLQPNNTGWDAKQVGNSLTNCVVLNTGAALDQESRHVAQMGTIEGLEEYILSQNSSLKKVFAPNESPLNGHITELYTAYDGTLFVGTAQGLYSIHPHKSAFQGISFAHGDGTKNPVSVIQVQGDSLLVGHWGSPLRLHHLLTGQSERIEPEIKNYKAYLYSLLLHRGDVWLACKNAAGVYRFPLAAIRNGRVPAAAIQQFLSGSASKERIVTRIYAGADGRLWFGTWEGELYVWSESEQQPRHYLAPEATPWLGYPIRTIDLDKQGRLWVGTSGKGVYSVAPQQGQMQATSWNIGNQFIVQVRATANNNTWVLSEKGLVAIETSGKSTEYIAESQQLDMHSMEEDFAGHLWVATQRGLLRINTNTPPGEYNYFTTNDGLRNRNFFHQAMLRDNSGRLYFGGNEGVDHFLPHQIDYNFQRPQPRITDFFLQQNRLQAHELFQGKVVLKENISTTRQLVLKYDQNSFDIEFSNIQFSLPDKAQYAYRLEGADPDWVLARPEAKRASYSNLRWGSYTFLLKSCNNDGFWNETPTRLQILIQPPMWATPWAYAAYVGIVAGLMLFFNKRTIVKVRHLHSIEMNELRYKKQQELDEAKLRFFTNISHELRTPLSLLLGPLGRILESPEPDRWREYHLLMYRNADRLLKLINRLMDFSKDEQEKLRLQVQVGDLGQFLRPIFDSFQHEALQRQIDYRFESSTALSHLYFDRDFVESIVYNLLSNAFKYSPNNSSIRLQTGQVVYRQQSYASVRIADQGRGIAPEHLANIFERFFAADKLQSGTGIGLSFTKRLVDLHQGHVLVESQLGQGSSFTVLLPLGAVYTAQQLLQQSGTLPQATVDWQKVNLELSLPARKDLEAMKNDTDKNNLIALVADDSADLRSFLREILSDTFEVVEAEDGEVALSLARELIPDIIVSDVMMPNLDGYALCQAIKQDPHTDHIPVILTTVLGSQDDRIKGLKFGADSYIPKPLNAEHLLVRVRMLLEQQQRMRKKYMQGTFVSNTNIPTPTDVKPTAEALDHDSPLIAEATRLIEANLHKPSYSVDDFCADLKISRMQLYRKLKATTGLSANIFIRKIRLKKAAEMLATGKYSVKEVTFDVGFSDLKYFRRCFKEEFGYNPSELLPNHEGATEEE